ncbi:hypothetical protein F5Y07DRAFT_317004 [Xylaria sp. FL0933]|nr:hypothetical protein F5Y07DRAFT_317004 [Xylaria sp. FL0933]
MSDNTQLLGRQLLRFFATKHPNTQLIKPQDLPEWEAASSAESSHTLSQQTPDDIIPYPLEWAESKRKFQTFLKTWRKQHQHEQQSSPTFNSSGVFSEFPPAAVQSESSESKGQPTPSESSDSTAHRSSDYDTDESTIQLLADLSIHSPPGPRPTDSSEPDSPGPSITMAAPPMTAEQIAEIVSRTVAATMDSFRQKGNQNGENGNVNTNTSILKAEEVGFFNPSFKDHDGSGAVAQGKQTIYTDVWAFTDRLTHLAVTHGEDKVRTVWTTCLQATALSWHTMELTDLEKDALRTGDVKRICTALQNRFKTNHSDALLSLQQKKFTLHDLRQGKSLRPFIQGVIRDGKSCDYSVKNQLLAVFESLDPEIQSELDKPNADTTLAKFLEKVDDRESVLMGKARLLPYYQTPVAPSQPVSAYYGKHNFPYNAYPPSTAQPTNIPPYQSPYYPQRGRGQYQRGGYPAHPRGGFQSRGGYRQAQPQDHPHTQGQRYGQAPGQSQRNPDRNADGNRQNQAQRYSPTPHTTFRPWQDYRRDNRPPPPYQRNQQRAYHTVDHPQEEYEFLPPEDSSWDVPNDQDPGDQQDHFPPTDPIFSCGDIPEDFGPPDTSEDKAQHAYEATNFGVILTKPHTCRRCNKSFKSNNALHVHIRDEHLQEPDVGHVDGNSSEPATSSHHDDTASSQDAHWHGYTRRGTIRHYSFQAIVNCTVMQSCNSFVRDHRIRRNS